MALSGSATGCLDTHILYETYFISKAEVVGVVVNVKTTHKVRFYNFQIFLMCVAFVLYSRIRIIVISAMGAGEQVHGR